MIKETASASGAEDKKSDAPKKQVDITLLAKEIYKLLQKEKMLEFERRGTRGGPNELN